MTAPTGAPVIALLASQLRADDKRLLEALERPSSVIRARTVATVPVVLMARLRLAEP